MQLHLEAAAQLTVTENSRFVPNSAAHVTLNSLHFAAYYSLVFRLVGTRPIAVLYMDSKTLAHFQITTILSLIHI